MNNKQFALFVDKISEALTKSTTTSPSASIPKISIMIPRFKGKPGENVITWMLQVQNIFIT